jgi:hypothetical protein
MEFAGKMQEPSQQLRFDGNADMTKNTLSPIITAASL